MPGVRFGNPCWRQPFSFALVLPQLRRTGAWFYAENGLQVFHSIIIMRWPKVAFTLLRRSTMAPMCILCGWLHRGGQNWQLSSGRYSGTGSKKIRSLLKHAFSWIHPAMGTSFPGKTLIHYLTSKNVFCFSVCPEYKILKRAGTNALTSGVFQSTLQSSLKEYLFSDLRYGSGARYDAWFEPEAHCCGDKNRN